MAGNAALVHTTRNALVTCDLAGIDVPVHAGAGGALAGETRDATHVHGNEGLEGVIPAAAHAPAGTMRRASSWRPRVRRPACGSLPSARSRTSPSRCSGTGYASVVAGISIMGGGTFGNATPAAEFNIWADPEAADVVFRSARASASAASISPIKSVPTRVHRGPRAIGSPLGDFVRRCCALRAAHLRVHRC